MSEEALPGRIRGELACGVCRRRWVRSVTEAGYDTAAWLGGLLVADRATADAYLTKSTFWYGPAAIALLVVGCGLVAGLYRSRYLRGSRDEVAAVVLAGFLTACCLAITGLALVTGRRALLETVLGGAAVALVAMLGARYVVFVARQRPRTPDPTAEKINVFGAGDAGTQLIHRMSTQRGAAYRPGAILDDDLAKRRLRITSRCSS